MRYYLRKIEPISPTQNYHSYSRISVMSSPLFQFLERFRCKPGQKWGDKRTHYSIAQPAGSYAIPDDQMTLFRSHYRKSVFKEGVKAHLVEANQDCTPIKIDLDFHYTLTDQDIKAKQTRVYNASHIEDFVMLYMQAVEEFHIPLRDNERLCLVMEKPSPVRNEKQGPNAWKDGIHIVFPKIVCHHTVQALLRNQVLKQMEHCFPRGIFTNPWTDILDSHIIRSSGWQMLGSRKPGKDAYAMTRGYTVMSDSCEPVDTKQIDTIELIEMTSMLGYKETDCLPIRQEKKEEIEKRISASRPATRYKQDIRPGVLTKYGDNPSHANSETIDLVKKLVELLRVERSHSYNSWIEVGWCLHNIHNSDHQLLDVWVEFSKQSQRHRREADSACREEWTKMSNQGLGIGTLRMWAREDNYNGYKELIKDELFPRILSMCRNDGKVMPGDVSDLMTIMYRDQFICINEKPEIWYRFSKMHHRWIKTEPVVIRREISTKVYQEFKDVHQYYIGRSQDSESEDHKKATNVFKGMNKLKTPAFKSNIVKELMEPFYDTNNEFFDTLNEKRHLLGMENGTYDLLTDTFRAGRPDDRITYSTKCRYPNMMDPTTEQNVERKMVEITEFIQQILPNVRVRNFVMNVLASFLSGDTNEEHFHIWTGSGGNGKSKLIELFENAIGDYGCKLPVSLITGKRSASSAASPEIAMLKGKRFACLQEPSEGSKINAGLMKEMTGGDKMYARALFTDPIEFKPQFKMVLTCNELPELPKDDGGVWRRVKMVHFPAKFKPRDELTPADGRWNADKTRWSPKDPMNPVYPMDETIDQKFDSWKNVFLYMLLQQYKEYREKGLTIPPEVKATTKEYKQSQFKLGEFFKDCIQTDTDYVVQVSTTEIYNFYKDWYMESQGGNKKEMLKKLDLSQYLESYYSEYRVNGSNHLYTNLRFVDDHSNSGRSIDMISQASFQHESELEDES